MRHWSGLDVKYASRRAAAAERARARIRFLGFTPKGHPLWTEEEDAILRACYPDYKHAIKCLRRRTYYACRAHARHLQIVRTRRAWTAADVSKLRRLFGPATRQEILRTFPEWSWPQIQCKAQSLGLKRKRQTPRSTPWQPIDAIKQRARELNYSLSDVDKLAGSKTYFARAGWTGRRQMNFQYVGRAVEALGGRLVVVWD